MDWGLLWLDADKKRDIADKVARAAARYLSKFGQEPNLCYVNASMIDSTLQVNGVRVEPAHNVLKHHFWIGREETT